MRVATIPVMNAMDVFENSKRVFILDETNIQLCPLTVKVVSFRATKNAYEVGPSPCKSTLSFVGTFNASGSIVVPATIYPYLRLPSDISEQVPNDFLIDHSDSEWMRSENFYEDIANDFIPIGLLIIFRNQ